MKFRVISASIVCGLLVVIVAAFLDRANGELDSRARVASSPRAKTDITPVQEHQTRSSKSQPIKGKKPLLRPPEMQELLRMAGSNDSRAASTLANYANKCQRLVSSKDMSDAFLAEGLNTMTLEQKKTYQAQLESLQELINDYGEVCDSYGSDLTSHRLNLLLQAANLGDRRAAACFTQDAIDLTGATDDSDQIRSKNIRTLLDDLLTKALIAETG